MSPHGFGARARVGALLLVLGFVAASVWGVCRIACDLEASDEPSAIAMPAPLDRDVRAVSAERAAERVERPNRARVRPPNAPAEGADAESLWTFGEQHLGWTSRADVDISQHSSAELRAWIDQDLRLYDLNDGLGYDELDVGYDE